MASTHSGMDKALMEALKALYNKVYLGNSYEPCEKAFDRLVDMMVKYKKERRPVLTRRDQENKQWFLDQQVVGMTMYVDLFSTDLEGFHERIGYLKDLGVSFVHFMPLLQGRPGENDGGYAVMDYKAIDKKYGDMSIFQKLIDHLHTEGINGCVDFVLNHTAKEHEWAQKALKGDATYMDMYFMFEDDTIPDVYEATLPEVFPGVAPGNFTYYEEVNRYVMTSFYDYQWDLNFKNPMVFEKMADIILYLSNIGVDMIRLDAIPFMWKELGTTCRNLPTVHLLVEMYHLIVALVAPSVALLGEAIVEAEEIVKYFGGEKTACDVMYNAPMMVNIWNSLATRDTTLLKVDINRLQIPPNRAWINYARCHDDIGWGFNEAAVAAMGLSPFDHKQFLIHFYKGDFPDSFSTGELYEFDAKTMDARNCGTMASLCGLEKALKNQDDYQKELALKRIDLINGLIMSTAGIPLIYSGDEVAQLNSYKYLEDDKKAHDSRWLHRRTFEWEVCQSLDSSDTPEGYVFKRLKKLIHLRKTHGAFEGNYPTRSLELYNPKVLGTYKDASKEAFIGVFNFSEDRQRIQLDDLWRQFGGGQWKDLVQGKTIDFSKKDLLLGPYEWLWLSEYTEEI